MPDTWDDDLRLLNALKGGGTDTAGFGRSNPVMRDFFAAQQGMTNMRANQERMNILSESRQERKQLKNALSGMDMGKPDYGKLLSLAPVFTQKLMATMADLNEQDRLKAVNVAANATKFFQMALPNLMQNPNAYGALRKTAKEQFGLSDEYLDAAIPNPQEYADNPQGWATAIPMALNFNKTMDYQIKQLGASAAQKLQETKHTGKLAEIEAIKAKELAVKNISLAIANLQATGKEQKFYDETDKRWNIVRMTANGEIKHQKMPEGWVPEKIQEQREKPTTGKSGGSGKKGLSAAFDKEGTTPEFKPGTYRINGKLHYIDTKEKFEALTK